MQIQQSHFFTMDLFVNAFALLAIYFAVKILDARYSENGIRESTIETPESETVEGELSEIPEYESPITNNRFRITNYALSFIRNPLFLLSIGFGVAYGMALASKLNIYPLAILLPGAFAVRYWTVDRGPKTEDVNTVHGPRSTVNNYWTMIAVCLIAGGLASIISFRIFQPYAFDGLKPDPRWVANITQQRAQATGESDMPWNLQWARRSHLYSFTNLTVWGLGLPLGILAWAGFL